MTTVTVNSLTVTWKNPTTGGGTSYTVTLKDGENTVKTKNHISETTATFSTLTAGKLYAVVVVSEIGDLSNGGQSSAEAKDTCYTSKSVQDCISSRLY